MNSDEARHLDIRAYVRVVRRWLWLIIAATLLAGLSALVVSRSSAPIYEASAALLVGQIQTTSTPDYNTILLNERLAKTYSQLLTGKPVMREVAIRLGLPADDAALNRLSQSVSAELVKDTQLVRLKARDANPARAADMANTILQVFIEQNQGALGGDLASAIDNLGREMQDLQARIDATQASLDEEQAKPSPDKATIARLDDQLRQDQATYDSFQQNYDQLRLAQARGNSMLTIFEKAETPTRPILPRTQLDVLLASLIGAMLSTGTAFFLEYMDDSIRGPEDVQRATGLSTLATIGRYAQARAERGPLLATNPYAPSAEGYRMLRTSVQLSALGIGRSSPILLASGVQPLAGTTTVLANLGVGLAQIGKQVLLVDANLHQPTLHKQFNLSNDTGLMSLLLHGATFEQAIQPTEIEGLRVLTAGPLPPNPAQVMNSSEMAALFEHFRALSAYVLLDTPPILTVPDTCLLAQEADGVLLIAELGKTTVTDLQRAASALARVRTSLLGVVLNKVPDQLRRY